MIYFCCLISFCSVKIQSCIQSAGIVLWVTADFFNKWNIPVPMTLLSKLGNNAEAIPVEGKAEKKKKETTQTFPNILLVSISG